MLLKQDDESGEIAFYMKGADVVMHNVVQYNDWMDEEVCHLCCWHILSVVSIYLYFILTIPRNQYISCMNKIGYTSSATFYLHINYLHFNGIFPGDPGLACFIEAKDDGSDGDNWSYKSCKAPVTSTQSTNQRPVFLQAGFPSCRQTNSVKALKGN